MSYFKNFVILIVLILVIIFLNPNALKINQYGAFHKLARLNYKHIEASAIKLEDGSILILGDDLIREPSEIYNPQTNTVSVFNFPEEISIHNKGLSLPNNQLLLVGVCDRQKEQCTESQYNKIAIFDITSNKILQYSSFQNFNNLKFYDYFYMNDGKVIFILSDEQTYNPTFFVFGIYNIEKNSITYSKEYYIKTETGRPKGIQINNDEILIFQNKSKILKYNIKNNTLEETKSENPLDNSSYTLIGDKVLIIGSSEFYDCKNDYNLLYDIKGDAISKIPPIITKRRLATNLLESYNPIYGVVNLDANNILITGGKGTPKSYNPKGLALKEAEIFDINKKEFVNLSKMNCTHNSHNSILMDNGDVVLIGGETYCGLFYIYNSNKNKSVIEKFSR